MKSGIIWRRTSPECAPGTDGVALFEGSIIGQIRLLAEGPQHPRPWMWSVTMVEAHRRSDFAALP